MLSMDGTVLSKKSPAKNGLCTWHCTKSSETGAIIHTPQHLFRPLELRSAKNDQDCIPDDTPFLKMKLGTVELVAPYEKPGSEALFQAFRERVGLPRDGFLLKNHGPVVPGKSVHGCLFRLEEELEESARIAWELSGRSGIESQPFNGFFALVR